MRFLLFFLLTSLATSLAFGLEKPSKRGSGLFGFGGSNKNEMSNGLFPEADQRSVTTASKPQEIFRDGKPKKTEPTSYFIDRGRKVEKPLPITTKVAEKSKEATEAKPSVEAPTAPALATGADEEKKRGGWFNFWKKDSPTDSPAIPPVESIPAAPLATNVTATQAVPSKLAPTVAPAPAPSAGPNSIAPTAPPVATNIVASSTPVAEESTDKAFGWIPFLRKKKVETPAVIQPIPAAPLVAAPVEPAAAASASHKPATSSRTIPSKKETKSASSSTSDVATFEIKRDENAPTPEKKTSRKSSDSSFSPSLPSIRFPKKSMDLSGAETIIQDGEIVNETGTPVVTSTDVKTSGPRQAPQVINGVKTYSSWKDVEARSVSAADKILNQIR